MKAETPLHLGRLNETDLDEADALLGRAFAVQASFRARLLRYLALSPKTWLALRGPRGLVGMVGANVFPGCAYIGLMAVAPEAQRQGHGERLMLALLSELETRGPLSFALDASAMGAPLYRRLGFREEGTSAQWDRGSADEGSSGLEPHPFGAEPSAERLDLRDGATFAELAALDARCFGHDRRRLWALLGQEFPGGVLGTRDEDGALDGYLCLQAGLAGPWGALTLPAAASLLRRAVEDPAFASHARVLVPSNNECAARLLKAAGFHETRRLLHMRREPGSRAAPVGERGDRWSCVYGKGSFCLG